MRAVLQAGGRRAQPLTNGATGFQLNGTLDVTPAHAYRLCPSGAMMSAVAWERILCHLPSCPRPGRNFMTRTMFDSVNPGAIPADAQMVAGCFNGEFAWPAEVWKRFPHAAKVRIDVTGAAPRNAGVLGCRERRCHPGPGGALGQSALSGWLRRHGVLQPSHLASRQGCMPRAEGQVLECRLDPRPARSRRGGRRAMDQWP